MEGTPGPRWLGSTGTSTCRGEGARAGAGQRLGRVRVETGVTHTESRGQGATPPQADEPRVRRDTAGARAESGEAGKATKGGENRDKKRGSNGGKMGVNFEEKKGGSSATNEENHGK